MKVEIDTSDPKMIFIRADPMLKVGEICIEKNVYVFHYHAQADKLSKAEADQMRDVVQPELDRLNTLRKITQRLTK